MSAHDWQGIFHNALQTWFRTKYGNPTPIQKKAWPIIADGDHILMSAPTGSGKTLAAFLYVIDQLLTGKISSGATKVLYVSPLKALNNDIEKNLQNPLDELSQTFHRTGLDCPEIRVATRSGDTPQNERRKMLRNPPEILITTPESLSIMLTSRGGREIFHDLEVVILDEVHGVFDNRRGVLLMSCIERLTDLSGEFQRVSLSATINPFEKVAEFVGGSSFDPEFETYTPRAVSIVRDESAKEYNLSVFYPENLDAETIWEPIVSRALTTIEQNRSTLFFANGRRLAETFTKKLNDCAGDTIAYAHHGSMSRSIREEVETRLRDGELKAIVATNTLEMGIDIGDLDAVMMIQSPNSIASGIQRVGRAGHGVGEVSKGTFLPTHPHDILDAAVLIKAIYSGRSEEMHPMTDALDVLAQIVISMTAHTPYGIDLLYNHIRRCFTYRNLSRADFDRVLNMLAGRYKDVRIRELKPRISIDGLEGVIRLRPGAEQVFYASGGVIPDRGYFKMRLGENGPVLGELDEEFVWENKKPGTRFTFGTQTWQVVKETHNDLIVSHVTDGKPTVPFWKGEGFNRSFQFSERIGEFLETIDEKLGEENLVGQLQAEYAMNGGAAQALVDLLQSQMQITGCGLPHRHHIVFEYVESGPGNTPGHQVILHNFWGNRLNHPYSLILQDAVEEIHGAEIEVYPHNNCIVLVLLDEMSPEEILRMVSADDIYRHLRNRLESSGFFGARFRECAGRALLIERRRINERMPLWMSRLRSQKLLMKIAKFEDFPVLLEAWRTCLQDEFEIEHLRTVLQEIHNGEIGWSSTTTRKPSPFAETVSWRQINQYMYMDDTAHGNMVSNLDGDLLTSLLRSEEALPRINRKLITRFIKKRQRVETGYSPSDSRELLEWTKDRLRIPSKEWETLLSAMENDHGLEREQNPGPMADRFHFHSDGSVCAVELLPRLDILTSLSPEAEEETWESGIALLGQWMEYYGPMTCNRIARLLNIDVSLVEALLEDMEEAGMVVVGDLLDGEEDKQVCHRENYDILLRISRQDTRPQIETRPLSGLQHFLAIFQGIGGQTSLLRNIEQLSCLPVDIQLLESDFLPVRVETYSPGLLDLELRDGGLSWIGCADMKIMLLRQDDLDLCGMFDSENDERTLLPDDGKFDLQALMRMTGIKPSQLCPELWQQAWAGKISNDSFEAVRKGAILDFKLPDPVPQRSRRRSAGRRWNTVVPMTGNWYTIHKPKPPEDLISQEDLVRDRVRTLLDRYGILFRELLKHELPEFQWKNIFRTLRIMELSGEIHTGYFFEDLSGPQFVSAAGLRRLQEKESTDDIYWINAHDPASLCGLGLQTLNFPPRLKTTHLVFQGSALILVSKRLGKVLEFQIPENSPAFDRILELFEMFLNRDVNPMITVRIQTINGDPASESAYLHPFKENFEVRKNGKEIQLYKKRF